MVVKTGPLRKCNKFKTYSREYVRKIACLKLPFVFELYNPFTSVDAPQQAVTSNNFYPCHYFDDVLIALLEELNYITVLELSFYWINKLEQVYLSRLRKNITTNKSEVQRNVNLSKIKTK